MGGGDETLLYTCPSRRVAVFCGLFNILKSHTRQYRMRLWLFGTALSCTFFENSGGQLRRKLSEWMFLQKERMAGTIFFRVFLVVWSLDNFHNYCTYMVLILYCFSIEGCVRHRSKKHIRIWGYVSKIYIFLTKTRVLKSCYPIGIIVSEDVKVRPYPIMNNNIQAMTLKQRFDVGVSVLHEPESKSFHYGTQHAKQPASGLRKVLNRKFFRQKLCKAACQYPYLLT